MAATEEIDLQTSLLVREEGVRLEPYRDSEGFWTVGVGHLIDRRKGGILPRYIEASFPLTELEVRELLASDLQNVKNGLDDSIAWWRGLDVVRRTVLVSMGFQLGVSGLLQFRETLKLLREGDYKQAAIQMSRSKWAKQTPARAYRHAAAIETGSVEALG